MNTLLSTTTRRALTSYSRRQIPSLSSVRWVSTLKEYKYTAKATATGAGRDGQVQSNDLKLQLSKPKELGGTGEGQNPEQLFAMGYAGCFLGAIQFQANVLKKVEQGKNAVVHAEVHIGPPAEGAGLGLAVDLTVEGVDEELLQAAHQMCPYSRAVKDSIVVNVKTA